MDKVQLEREKHFGAAMAIASRLLQSELITENMNSNGFPSREIVERVRKTYPTGCRVELISMDDPYSSLAPGTKGTVRLVDDTGTVFVSWDNGSGLGVVYGVDRIRKL